MLKTYIGSVFYRHDTGVGHPETQRRLDAAVDGEGKGRGFTLNIPLEAGAGDPEYLRGVEDEVVRVIDDYAPSAILLSSGFDAHRRDPLGGMHVSEEAYGEITKRVVECAERH